MRPLSDLLQNAARCRVGHGSKRLAERHPRNLVDVQVSCRGLPGPLCETGLVPPQGSRHVSPCKMLQHVGGKPWRSDLTPISLANPSRKRAHESSSTPALIESAVPG